MILWQWKPTMLCPFGYTFQHHFNTCETFAALSPACDLGMLICLLQHWSSVRGHPQMSVLYSHQAVIQPRSACPHVIAHSRVLLQCICQFVTVLEEGSSRFLNTLGCAVIAQQELVCLPCVFFSADIDTETMNEWHVWIMWWLGGSW